MKVSINKGFSLLEILLVITLLSILFTILVIRINPRSIIYITEDNKREADALTIYQALEQYSLKNNSYPEAIKNIPNDSSLYICKNTSTNCSNFDQINLSNILVPTYLSKIPEYSTDSNNSGFYIVKDINGKIGIGGVRRLDNTTFVKGLENKSLAKPVVTDGLVLYLDAGYKNSYQSPGTTWNDLSGNGNNGTLMNGVTYNGDDGGGLVFDGVNSYIAIPHNSSHNPTEITICAWVNSTDLLNSYGRNMNIVAKSGNDGYRIRINGGLSSTIGSITFFDRGAANAITTNGGLISIGNWYFITGVGSSSGLRIYLNGNLVRSNSTPFGGFTSTEELMIGNTSFGPGFIESFYGKISQTILYNRALTEQEIQQNFNASKGRFGL
jgi:prepilin-type N-terminal cleavage/methylation domain-containing protein